MTMGAGRFSKALDLATNIGVPRANGALGYCATHPKPSLAIEGAARRRQQER